MEDDGEFALQDQTTREQSDLTNRVNDIYGPFVKMSEVSSRQRENHALRTATSHGTEL